jgi:hypothetical protein
VPIDWQAAAERAQELADQGYSPTQVNKVLDDEMEARARKLGYANYAEMIEGQRSMAKATANLHADSVAAGQEPEQPLGTAILSAAFKAEGSTRPLAESFRPNTGFSDRAVKAGIDVLFERAANGDEAAVFKRSDESWNAAKARYDNRRR